MSDKSPRAVSAWEGHLLRAALLDSVRKLDPRAMVKNPVMFVVEIGSVLTTLVLAARRRGATAGHGARVVHRERDALAVVHGPLRELRRGPGRGPGQGPGGGAARAAAGDRGPQARRRAGGARPGLDPAQGRRGRRRGGRDDPRRRRGDRGHRVRGRVGRHRRVRSRHPRERRRPLGGHRGHAGALRPHRGPDRDEPGRVLPRPDDRPRGGGEAAEDAERDRPHRPPRRHDHHLPDRLRDARSLRPLLGPSLLASR